MCVSCCCRRQYYLLSLCIIKILDVFAGLISFGNSVLKLINTLEMFVQKSLFYETTVLLWKRKSHWTVTKIIFRNRELTGTNASKSKTGTQCCVSPCTAQLPSCWLCTHLCFSSTCSVCYLSRLAAAAIDTAFS